MFQHGFAFCTLCGSLPPEAVLRAIGVIQDPLLAAHTTRVLGLTFWTPRKFLPLNVWQCWQAEDRIRAELAVNALPLETYRS